MKVIYNILVVIQWVAFLGGLVSAFPLWLYFSPTVSLLALVVAFLALACLKLEVLSFAR